MGNSRSTVRHLTGGRGVGYGARGGCESQGGGGQAEAEGGRTGHCWAEAGDHAAGCDPHSMILRYLALPQFALGVRHLAEASEGAILSNWRLHQGCLERHFVHGHAQG